MRTLNRMSKTLERTGIGGMCLGKNKQKII